MLNTDGRNLRGRAPEDSLRAGPDNPEAAGDGTPRARSCTGQAHRNAERVHKDRRSGGEVGSLRQGPDAEETYNRRDGRRSSLGGAGETARDSHRGILHPCAGCTLHEEGVRDDIHPLVQQDTAGGGT